MAVSDLLEKGKPDSMDRQILIAILNFWEEVAIAVFSHEADERLLRDFFPDTMVLRTFGVTQEWIRKARVEKKLPHGVYSVRIPLQPLETEMTSRALHP